MQDIRLAITKLIQSQSLSEQEMQDIMHHIMCGKVNDIQLAGFLVALSSKGESVAEITAAVKVIRDLAWDVPIDGPHVVDIVGTGGDQSNLFNVSTASAFVAAAAGAIVAKHHNRSVSSHSGSADVLTLAGIPKLEVEQVADCISQIGIGFMFAPNHHRSWSYTLETRRALGVKTLFNLLGPLVNPAQVKKHLIGVYSKRWLKPFAEVLAALGSEHAVIVHSRDGLDEISIAAPTDVAELKNGQIHQYTLNPEQFGFTQASLEPLRVQTPQQSLAIIQGVFEHESGSAMDMVILNAGVAIYAADIVPSIEEGLKLAKQIIATGAAKEKFVQLIHYKG